MLKTQHIDSRKIFFVSYSRRDETKVRKLIQALKDIDHDVWYDKHLVGGQEWWDEIINRIYKCEYFIFALSRNSWYSEACRKELQFAKALNKWIIPIVVSGDFEDYSLPDWLASRQHINYDSSNLVSNALLAELASRLQAPNPLPEPIPPAPDPPRLVKNLYLQAQRYAMIILPVLLIAVLAIVFINPGKTQTKSPVKIAVKYFASNEPPAGINLSDSSLVQEITCRLQTLDGAVVRGPGHLEDGMTGVMLAGAALVPEDVERRALDEAAVTHLLGGEIIHRGDVSTITIELTERQQDQVILRDTFLRNITVANASTIIDELAESVARTLDLKAIQHTATRDVRLDKTTDEQSLEYLSLARRAWRLRTQESFQDAIILLNKAIDEEPRFWRAHGFLALVYTTGAEGDEIGDSLQPFEKAKYHATLALDNLSGTAQVSDALVAMGDYYENQRNFMAAEERFHKAISLDDSHTTAHQALAELYLYTGRHDLATRYMDKAFGQSTWGNPTVMWLRSKLMIAAGDYEQGKLLAAKVLELDPEYTRAKNYLWEYHLIKGDLVAAEDECANAPSDNYEFIQRALIFLEREDFSAYQAHMMDASEYVAKNLGVLADFAQDQYEHGIATLRELMDSDSFEFIWILQTDPYRICDNVNKHPAAIALMREYGIELRRHPKYL